VAPPRLLPMTPGTKQNNPFSKNIPLGRPRDRIGRWLFGIASLLVAVGAIAAAVFGYVLPLSRETRSAAAWVEHTQAVIVAIGRVQTSVETIMADARGFVLTDDPNFLGLSTQSDAIWARFAEVRVLTADNPRQQDHLNTLSNQISAQLAVVARMIQLTRGGDSKRAADVVRGGEGEAFVNAIRLTTTDMIAEEQRLLIERHAKVDSIELWSTRIVVSLCILAICGLLVSFVIVARALLARAANRDARAAAAERQQLLDLIGVSLLMVLRDASGKIIYWSDGCAQLYGWTSEQATGRLAHELLQTTFPCPQAEIETALHTTGSWHGQLRQKTQSGAEVIVVASKVVRDFEDGTEKLIVTTMADVTALRQAEAELKVSEAQLHSLVDTAADGFIIAKADGRIQSVNRAVLRMFGYERADQLIGGNLTMLMPAADGARHDGYIRAHRSGAPPRAIDVPGRDLLAIRRDGSEFPIELSVSSFGTNGDHYLTGIIRDATARKQAEMALRDSETKLRLFIDGAPAAIAMFDTQMRYLAVSRRFIADYQIGNQTQASLLGRSHYEVFPEIPENWRIVHNRVLSGETLSSDEEPFPREDGYIDWVRWEMVPWRLADGTIGGALLFSESTTDRKMAEAALRDSEARLRLVQQVGGIAYSDRTLPDLDAFISEEFIKLYGLPCGQTRMAATDILAMFHPGDREAVEALTRVAWDQGGVFTTEFRILPRDRPMRWITMRFEVLRGPDGKPNRLISAQQDITEIVAARQALASHAAELERRVAERTAALGEAEARFRGIFDSQFQFIILLSLDGTILEMNRTALDASGLTRGGVVGQPAWEIGLWPAAERKRLRREIAQAAQGEPVRRELEINGARGRSIWTDFSLTPSRDPATGAVMWIIAEGRDLTENRNLANQLVQAQKVQALGQLAGGIAHDFNNILQAVSGAAALIELRPDNQEKVRRLSATIITASARGTSITQRLLSFARRGDLRSEVVATADLLNNMCEVLAHTLGSTISIRTEVPADIPALVADQAQLETAIINLGTNARDAMPDGGTLVLSAEADHVRDGQVHPAALAAGDYVRLTIADNGIGMDAAVLARVNEPFFTTKPQGQGTGLGVPMVKGFAEQSGGGLSIASTPGSGTTVVLWLRQASDTVVSSPDADSHLNMGHGPSARILIVDDDDLVRETVAAQLEAEGLLTLVASSGPEAIALIEAGEVIDAMVSDLSMPGMNGVTAIEKVRAMRPGLPCFLMTGYVGERAALSSANAFTLVRKPISGRALVAQIEASLEGARR